MVNRLFASPLALASTGIAGAAVVLTAGLAMVIYAGDGEVPLRSRLLVGLLVWSWMAAPYFAIEGAAIYFAPFRTRSRIANRYGRRDSVLSLGYLPQWAHRIANGVVASLLLALVGVWGTSALAAGSLPWKVFAVVLYVSPTGVLVSLLNPARFTLVEGIGGEDGYDGCDLGLM
jgi:hypothetical protein